MNQEEECYEETIRALRKEGKVVWVWWAEAPYHDGFGEYGYWKSPLYATKEAAQQFAMEIAPVFWGADDVKVVGERVLPNDHCDTDLMQLLWHYKEYGELHSKIEDIESMYLTVVYAHGA